MFGVWDSQADGEVHKILFLFGQMIWQTNGETFEYEMPNDKTIVLDMGEEQFVAKLAHGGNSLVWDDGDIWLRSSYRPRGIVKSKKEKRPRTKRGGRPPKRRRVHFNREPQVRRFISIEPWDLDLDEEEDSSDEDAYGYGYNSDDDDPYGTQSASDYDDTLEVSDSELSRSEQLSAGGGMFSPSIDSFTMQDSSTLTSSEKSGGAPLLSANNLLPGALQHHQSNASQDSLISTGGLYTPSSLISTGGLYTPSVDELTSTSPNQPISYPPTPSCTSLPTVDTTLTSIDSNPYNRGSRHSTISTHTSDADFDRFNSERSLLSDQSDVVQYENVFENVKKAQKGSIAFADQSDSTISVGSASGITPALRQQAQVAPTPTLDSLRHLKGSETSLSEYENVFENMHALNSPEHLQDRDEDESSEDSSTSDELGEWPPRLGIGMQANPKNPVSNDAQSPLDSTNKRTMAGGGRRFNSIIIKHQEGPQHHDFKKFESNFRLGIQLKRRPRPQNTQVGSPRAHKEDRRQRILTRQATPYHGSTSPTNLLEALENEKPLVLNTEENSHNHENAASSEHPKKHSLKKSKAVITRAKTQMQEAKSPLLEPVVALSRAPKRAATSDRLMMSAEKTMLQAYNLLRKKKKKRFSLGVKKAASEQVFSPEAVSPLDVDPQAPMAREMQRDSPVTGTLSPRFNIATIPAPVEIINSPLKSTNSTEIERRAMISYASVASAADSDDESENEPHQLVGGNNTPDANSAYLIHTTSSFLEETSEHNIYTEESDSFSLEEGVDEDLSNSGSSGIAASLISASQNHPQKSAPSKKEKPRSTGGKSRKKKSRRSFNLGAKRSSIV